VAQVTLREAPEGLRSVIIDSVMPIVLPELPGGLSSFEIALQRLFDSCEADPACNTAYPNLANALRRAIQRLNQNPVTLQTNCYGEEQSAYLTGERLVSMLFNSLYETDYAPALPDAISAAADGSDYSFWNNIVCWEAVIDDLLTDGAHLAIQCSDGRLGNDCEDWPIVVEQTPVTSEIPVLVLGGEFDPVTPLEYGHSVAQTLSQSYVVDFPGMGHWINGTGQACQSEIIQAFLDDPTLEPARACIDEMEQVLFLIAP
jgi:pimeloyl-ACP methyl ester carboxylesterase